MTRDAERPYWNEEWLRTMYAKHESVREVAERADCGYETARKWLNRYDIIEDG